MRSNRFSNELLDALRFVGDPYLDDHVKTFTDGRLRAEMELLRTRNLDPEDRTCRPTLGASVRSDQPTICERQRLDDYWTCDYGGRDIVDVRDTDLAHELFRRFGQEIGGSLLLASLPHSYAAEDGAAVLARTNELNSNLSDRVFRTTQFLIDVMTKQELTKEEKDGLGADALADFGGETNPNYAVLAGGRGHLAARRTRFAHAIIRRRLMRHLPQKGRGEPVELPINTEHLLGTYLSFCVTVWESLERLGIRWSEREKSAYFHHWDWIAHLMGIGHRSVIEAALERAGRDAHALLEPFGDDEMIRPRDVEEAQDLLTRIRDRNWPTDIEGSAFTNVSGKRLTRALLAELEHAMPPTMQRYPIEMMRYLSDERVKAALGLGDTMLPPTLLDWVQGASRGWNLRRANPLIAPTARFMVNQVSLHAIVAWSKDRPDLISPETAPRSDLPPRIDLHLEDDPDVYHPRFRSHLDERYGLREADAYRTEDSTTGARS